MAVNCGYLSVGHSLRHESKKEIWICSAVKTVISWCVSTQLTRITSTIHGATLKPHMIQYLSTGFALQRCTTRGVKHKQNECTLRPHLEINWENYNRHKTTTCWSTIAKLDPFILLQDHIADGKWTIVDYMWPSPILGVVYITHERSKWYCGQCKLKVRWTITSSLFLKVGNALKLHQCGDERHLLLIFTESQCA